MRWLLIGVLIPILHVGMLTSARAGSMLIEVTPANIASQPLKLRLEAEADGHGSIHFEIRVSADRDKISPSREGRLEIARDPIHRTIPGKDTSMPWPLTWCSVQEVEKDGVLDYNFGVALGDLPKASFQFRNYDPSGMPSMDVYRFVLQEFAPVK